MQDLSGFSVPKGFRGGNAIKVQLWWAVQATIFAWSPQVLYRWRAFLLRLFGAKIGKNVVIRPSVKITYPWKLTLGDYAWVGDEVNLYTLGEITIGAHSVISQKSYLCTGSHDHASQHFTINATPIVIGEKCWLATDVFVALASRSATAPSWVREAVFLNRFRQMWFAGESRSGDTRTR